MVATAGTLRARTCTASLLACQRRSHGGQHCVDFFLRVLITKACVKCARNSWARELGIYVYDPNPHAVRQGIQRLFLESYFDVAFCAFLNLVAFYTSADMADFAGFFETEIDAANSVGAICFLIAVLIFPYYVWRAIKKNFENLGDDKKP